jgi:hypothetical protein
MFLYRTAGKGDLYDGADAYLVLDAATVTGTGGIVVSGGKGADSGPFNIGFDSLTTVTAGTNVVAYDRASYTDGTYYLPKMIASGQITMSARMNVSSGGGHCIIYKNGDEIVDWYRSSSSYTTKTVTFDISPDDTIKFVISSLASAGNKTNIKEIAVSVGTDQYPVFSPSTLLTA